MKTKTVREEDLKNLIAQFYCDFVDLQPVSEITDGNSSVDITINSICIYVIDYSSFNSEDERKKCLEQFAEQIKAISFGNLKVTYYGCKKDGNSYFSWMYIANAYNVID